MTSQLAIHDARDRRVVAYRAAHREWWRTARRTAGVVAYRAVAHQAEGTRP